MLLAAMLAACSSEPTNDVIELTTHLPPAVEQVGYVDASQVRADLGLTDPTDETAALLLRPYLFYGLPFLATPDADSRPLVAALDLWAVEEALAAPIAAGFATDSLLVVRTEQPWEDIASVLQAEGYADRGDGVLVTERPLPEVSFAAVGSLDGVVVAAQDPDVVAARLTPGDDYPTDLVEVLAAAPGPVVGAAISPLACVAAYGAGIDAPSTGGAWVLLIDESDDGAVTLDDVAVSADEEWGPGLFTGAPELDGRVITVPLNSPDGDPLADAMTLFATNGGPPPGFDRAADATIGSEVACP
jgi:hypothetical protein